MKNKTKQTKIKQNKNPVKLLNIGKKGIGQVKNLEVLYTKF